MSYDVKYEHQNGRIVFSNGVSILQDDYNALSKLKAYATCEPSFIWSELLRLQDNQDTLVIYFFKASFKRKQRSLEVLRDSKHFIMETSEILVNNKTKIQLTLSKITPEFKSIIPMF